MRLLMIFFFINIGCPLLKGRLKKDISLAVMGEGNRIAYSIAAEEGDEVFNMKEGVLMAYDERRNILKIETEKGVLRYTGVENLNPTLEIGQIVEENTLLGYLDNMGALVIGVDDKKLAPEIWEAIHCSCGY